MLETPSAIHCQTDQLQAHDHPCLIYENLDELVAAFVPFLRAGLALGERCIYFVNENSRQFVLDAMTAGGFDLQPYLERDAFCIIHTDDAHVQGGYFAEPKMVEYWGQALREAREAGFSGLRAAVEMTWALGGHPGCEVLVPYESRLNNFTDGHPVSVICSYRRQRFTPELIKGVIHAHPLVIAHNQVLENPNFIRPCDFVEGSAALDVQAMIDNLALLNRLRRAQDNLAQTNNELSQVRDELDARVEARTNELQASELRYRALAAVVEYSDDAIISKDMAGIITGWNPSAERLYGYSAAEAIGQPITLIMPTESPDEFPGIMSRLTRGERVDHYETTRVAKDGTRLQVSVSISPLRDETGRIIGAASIARDMTQQRALEAKVQQAQKMESLGVLAGGIAHDFNNLLMGVLGNASLALYKLPPGSPVRFYIEQIDAAGKRAAELTNQMLAYSGKGRFIVTELNLNLLIEEMSQLLEISISKQAVLNFRLAPGLPAVEADGGQLRQVVLNLIVNASEAIGEQSGVITLSTGALTVDAEYLKNNQRNAELPLGTYDVIEVADTGIGMDIDTQSRIFDPFFSTKFTGRGLGMAAVQGIVRGHKGAITVDSEPGQGSTVRVLLPALSPAVAEADAIPPAPDLAAGSGRGTVLVVDDEETVRAVTRMILVEAGFDVLVAADGREAVQLYRERGDGIALVLLDLTMPHMNGRQTFEALRRIRPDARIILSSGYNEEAATDLFGDKELAGFIHKPYTPGKLLAKVQAVLASAAE